VLSRRARRPPPAAAAAATAREGIAGTLAAVTSGGIYGSIGILIKLAYRSDSSPTTLLAVRLAFGALMLWGFLFAMRLPRRIPRDRLPAFVAMGALFGGTATMFFVALTRISAATAILLLYAQPAFVAVLSASLGRERFGRLKLAALVLSLGGVVLVLGAPASRIDPWGAALALSAAALLAVHILIMQRAIAGLHPATASAAILGIAAVLFIPIAAVAGAIHLDAGIDRLGWGFLIGLISSVGLILFLMAVNLVGPTRSAIGATMEPVVTVVLATIVLGEHLTAIQAAGGLLVVAAVVLLPFIERVPVPEPHP
jgi:drug/metabolite transporter (DMT)-like permease